MGVKKRVAAMLLLLALLFSTTIHTYAAVTVQENIWDGSIAQRFDGGTGSETDPYEISSGSQLALLAQQVNSKSNSLVSRHYVLTADIVLNDTSNVSEWETTPPKNMWIPIGTAKNPFHGSFDGRGHVVKGLYINLPLESNQALFGFCDSAKIQKLTVSDSLVIGFEGVGGIVGNLDSESDVVSGCTNYATVKAENWAGGVVGYVDRDCVVTDCANYGEVSALNVGAGGITSDAPGMTVSYCKNYGTIKSGVELTGGIQGCGTAKDCVNYGAVTGNAYVGGISGGMTAAGAFINCCNFGIISGESLVGGITGETRSVITACYNVGDVICSGFPCGGIVGESYSTVAQSYNLGHIKCEKQYGGIVGLNSVESSIVECYYLDTSVINGSEYGKPLTEEQMRLPESYSGFDFRNMWTFEQQNGLDTPTLISMLPKTAGEQSSLWDGKTGGGFDGGSGSARSPYIISNASQLAYLAQCVNLGDTFEGKHFTLSNDIILNDVNAKYWTLNAVEWTPIGYYTYFENECKRFSGTFDGCGHKIGGIFVPNGGIFGYTDGTIKNVVIDNMFGYFDVGFVNNNIGTVDNCVNVGYVSGIHDVGGIVSVNLSGGTVKDCFNRGEVTGTMAVGGVVANSNRLRDSQTQAVTKNCGNVGVVRGASIIGGVVGFNVYSLVTGCFNASEVSGYDTVGGVVGGSAGSVVSKCVNTGNVSASERYAGGIVAANGSLISIKVTIGTVCDSYNMGDVTGDECVGGIVGRSQFMFSLSEVLRCHNIGNVSGKSKTGGVVGCNEETSTVKSCYYLDSSVVNADNTLATALTRDDMRDAASFAGFDFTDTWVLNPDVAYPTLRNNMYVTLGDVNGDSVVNTGDAVLVLRQGVGSVTFVSPQFALADYNNDGEVNTGDAVAILEACVSDS